MPTMRRIWCLVATRWRSPGNYLLLLGVARETRSVYFLSDGLSGSFVDDGDLAYQRCPNSSDPANPLVLRDGVLNQEQLIRLFADALAKKAGSS